MTPKLEQTDKDEYDQTKNENEDEHHENNNDNVNVHNIPCVVHVKLNQDLHPHRQLRLNRIKEVIFECSDLLSTITDVNINEADIVVEIKTQSCMNYLYQQDDIEIKVIIEPPLLT